MARLQRGRAEQRHDGGAILLGGARDATRETRKREVTWARGGRGFGWRCGGCWFAQKQAAVPGGSGDRRWWLSVEGGGAAVAKRKQRRERIKKKPGI